MAAKPALLSADELKRFEPCPVECPRDPHKIESLADYMAVVSDLLKGKDNYWFRGHRKVSHALVPSALRYTKAAQRERAMELLNDFKCVAEIKLDRPPRDEETLKWMQLAQHYGLPTRLLDWTQSATFALYFACENKAEDNGKQFDCMVFLMNRGNVSRLPGGKPGSSLDGVPEDIVAKYAKPRLSGKLPTIAINPIWNSPRLAVQRGGFTLHGTTGSLDSKQAPSLYGIPLLKEVRAELRAELGRVGVDEMTLFPELEHACNHLKRIGGLE